MTTKTFTAHWLDSKYLTIAGMSKLVVHREFVENQEYGALWRVVFLHDEKYWQVSYQTPIGQAHVDTWFDEEEVTATQVQPQAKFVTEWVPVGQARAVRCTASLVAAPPDGTVLGTCDMDAPFLVALLEGSKIESVERCPAHAHMLITSPVTFRLVQEVKRRWR